MNHPTIKLEILGVGAILVSLIIIMIIIGYALFQQSQVSVEESTACGKYGLIFDVGDTAYCQYNKVDIPISGKVVLPAGIDKARLQISYYIVNPPDLKTNPEYRDMGIVVNDQTVSFSVIWPGIRENETIVEIHVGGNLLSDSGNPIPNTTSSLDYYWYPWVCSKSITPTSTPSPGLSPTPSPTPSPSPIPTIDYLIDEYCGNSLCGITENCMTCSTDCGKCPGIGIGKGS